MKKIPTMYMRDPANMSRVTGEVAPGCEWVVNGEGYGTVKYDGTCCLYEDGVIFRRREVKKGRPTPDGFMAADETETKVIGWVPCGNGPDDKWHREAAPPESDGTCELIGPKVQGNPYGMATHCFVEHGADKIAVPLRDQASIRLLLEQNKIEGVVFYHEDGRRAKIKRRDFGLPWPEVSP